MVDQAAELELCPRVGLQDRRDGKNLVIHNTEKDWFRISTSDIQRGRQAKWLRNTWEGHEVSGKERLGEPGTEGLDKLGGSHCTDKRKEWEGGRYKQGRGVQKK